MQNHQKITALCEYYRTAIQYLCNLQYATALSTGVKDKYFKQILQKRDFFTFLSIHETGFPLFSFKQNSSSNCFQIIWFDKLRNLFHSRPDRNQRKRFEDFSRKVVFIRCFPCHSIPAGRLGKLPRHISVWCMSEELSIKYCYNSTHVHKSLVWNRKLGNSLKRC